MITPPHKNGTGTYTLVHQPTIEHRHGTYFRDELPTRYLVIRDQLQQQHLIMNQATHDAVRLLKPENAHLVYSNHNSQYLAAVAANAAMMAATLYQSSVSLQHGAHIAGYDTSSLAPLSQEIAKLGEEIQSQYVTFTRTIAGRLNSAPKTEGVPA